MGVVPQAQATAPVETVYTLPFAWDGAASISAQDLAVTAPPLVASDTRGEFTLSRVRRAQGDSIRILLAVADPDGAGARGQIRVAWSLPDEQNGIANPAGHLVTFSVLARAYSPPAGVQLSIGEVRGGVVTSNSAAMDGIEWTEYSVTQQIDTQAEQVQFSLIWSVTDDKAWLEFTDLRVVVVGADGESPADRLPAAHRLTPEAMFAPEAPTAQATATWTPLVVTSTPTPDDVFAAATRVAASTAEAATTGTTTPTPINQVTATFTPTTIVITATPTPGNEVTAQAVALLATAVAFTTGTPTPYPAGASVLVAATYTPTPTPAPAQVPPTSTPTPIYRLLSDLATTPATAVPTATPAFPAQLQGKILFLSDLLGTAAYAINPDGTGLALLTSRQFYDRAKARDAYSADRRFYAFARNENAVSQGGLIQIYYRDAFYTSTLHQMTYFGAGTAWLPAWSPVDERVALVSNESGNDEIWIVARDNWPATQITKNAWEWDKSPSFSPDGTQIVFESNRIGGRRQLWLMEASGQNPRQLTFLENGEAWEPVWVKYRDD